jgi:hypothetical protein
MFVIDQVAEIDLDQQAREMLEAQLEPGEALLGYARVRRMAGLFPGGVCAFGLTPTRFLLLLPQKKKRCVPLYFGLVQAVEIKESGLERTQLIVQLDRAGREKVTLQADGAWGQRLERIAAQYRQACPGGAISVPYPPLEKTVEQIRGLQALGMSAAAKRLLKLRREEITLTGSPAAQALLRSVSDNVLGKWVGAVMLVVAIGVFAVRFKDGYAQTGLGLFTAVLALVELLRGRKSGRYVALIFVLSAAVVNTLVYLNNASKSEYWWLFVLVWASYGVAMFLVLGGSAQWRVLAGVVLLLLAWGYSLPAFLGTLLEPLNGGQALVEDYSPLKVWRRVNKDTYQMAAAKGSYHLTLIPSKHYLIYSGSRKISYTPVRITADLRIAPGSGTTDSSWYGLVCRGQVDGEGIKYYGVLLNASTHEMLVVRATGTDLQNLLYKDPATIAGFHADAFNRLGLTCVNNTLTVTLNGKQLASISAPEMASFGAGEAGVILSNGENVTPGGFQVQLDNLRVEPY